jgi:hypothetical protein
MSLTIQHKLSSVLLAKMEPARTLWPREHVSQTQATPSAQPSSAFKTASALQQTGAADLTNPVSMSQRTNGSWPSRAFSLASSSLAASKFGVRASSSEALVGEVLETLLR